MLILLWKVLQKARFCAFEPKFLLGFIAQALPPAEGVPLGSPSLTLGRDMSSRGSILANMVTEQNIATCSDLTMPNGRAFRCKSKPSSGTSNLQQQVDGFLSLMDLRSAGDRIVDPPLTVQGSALCQTLLEVWYPSHSAERLGQAHGVSCFRMFKSAALTRFTSNMRSRVESLSQAPRLSCIAWQYVGRL